MPIAELWEKKFTAKIAKLMQGRQSGKGTKLGSDGVWGCGGGGVKREEKENVSASGVNSQLRRERGGGKLLGAYPASSLNIES